MQFNLISDPWIPVVRQSGKRNLACPAEISPFCSDPIVGIDGREVDWDMAITQFLCMLVQTACTLDESYSPNWKLSEQELQKAFDQYKDAFNLFGDGPRFMQVPTGLANQWDAEKNPNGKKGKKASDDEGSDEEDSGGLSSILACRETSDRGNAWVSTTTWSRTVSSLSVPAAACCLIASQFHAHSPNGGNYKPSSRGQVSAVFLLQGKTLWETVAANLVYAQENAEDQYPPYLPWRQEYGVQHVQGASLVPPVTEQTFLWMTPADKFPARSTLGDRNNPPTLCGPLVDGTMPYSLFAHMWGMAHWVHLDTPVLGTCGYFPDLGEQPVILHVRVYSHPAWLTSMVDGGKPMSHPFALYFKYPKEPKDGKLWGVQNIKGYRGSYRNWLSLTCAYGGESTWKSVPALQNRKVVKGYTLGVSGMTTDGKAERFGFESYQILDLDSLNVCLDYPEDAQTILDTVNARLKILKGALKTAWWPVKNPRIGEVDSWLDQETYHKFKEILQMPGTNLARVGAWVEYLDPVIRKGFEEFTPAKSITTVEQINKARKALRAALAKKK